MTLEIHVLAAVVKSESISMKTGSTVLKVHIKNVFNLISRQAILDECASLFPELLPWASWCYGTHSALWHPLGSMSSESGVQ